MLVHPQFNPVALALGPVQIHWYGLTYLVAFALFMALANARARQPAFAHAGWTRREVEDLLFWGVLGVVLGAWYMLWAVERVFFGGSREPPKGGSDQAAGHDHDRHSHGGHAPAASGTAGDRCDLTWYEVAALSPLAVFVLWIGITPAPFLGPPAATLRAVTRSATNAFAERMRLLEEADSLPAPAATASDHAVDHHRLPRHTPLILISERP